MTDPGAPASGDRPAVDTYALRFSCTDGPGIVHAVAAFILERGGNIVESQQFDSKSSGLLFMRAAFEIPAGEVTVERLRRDFAPIAARFAMSWELHDTAVRTRALIMVSKHGHCLNDLLFRASSGWFDIDVRAVVSNHADLAHLAENYSVPFHHIPVTAETKPAAEKQLLELVDELGVDLVVLARYMQILSGEVCDRLRGRAINIHHSMLPAFKGAKPYLQAHERGVKFIGATAHYVTEDLDEGPIIEQQVARINHTMSAAEVSLLGQDIECLALAHAVRWHSEHRIVIGGHRTVVFQ